MVSAPADLGLVADHRPGREQHRRLGYVRGWTRRLSVQLDLCGYPDLLRLADLYPTPARKPERGGAANRDAYIRGRPASYDRHQEQGRLDSPARRPGGPGEHHDKQTG